MAFSIYNPGEPDNVYLKLEKGSYGEITLFACNKDGERFPKGAILSITCNGKIRLSQNINSNLGFQLDPEQNNRVCCVV